MRKLSFIENKDIKEATATMIFVFACICVQ